MSKKSRDQRKRKRVQKASEVVKNVASEQVIKSESIKKARIEALNYLVMFNR